MKIRNVKKLNNQGSTFVLALIVIMFVTTLAVAVLSASLNNLTMKSVNRTSTGTFYTAESVLDEIRAGVGLDAMNGLGDSYESVLTNIVKKNASGYSYMIDNDTAMLNFKNSFIEKMLYKAVGDSLKFATGSEEVSSSEEEIINKVKDYLNTFIKGYDADMAKIESLGSIKAYKDSDSGLKHIIIFKDVDVLYKEKKAGEIYFSNVTVDLEIEFPNIKIDFSGTNRLDDFLNYALIADVNMEVKGCSPTIMGSVYAGTKLTVYPGVGTTQGGHLTLSGLSNGSKVNVVCGGDTDGGNIVVQGNADYDSSIEFRNANIWCTNLLTADYRNTKGATIKTDAACSSFVKDDLTSEGKNSSIELYGEYYGYSYDGNAADSIHANSSAIIINGKKTKMTIGTSRMILGGHSFVRIEGTNDYMTGEALSFIGDQDIYLVPLDCLNPMGIPDSDRVTNPMPVSRWDSMDKNRIDFSGFFAGQKGYLKDGEAYTVRKIRDRVYLYLNFKDKASAAQYIKDVANGAAGVPRDLTAKLNQNTASLLGGNSVKIADDTSIYTKGALLVSEFGITASAIDGKNPANPGDVSYSDSTPAMADDEFVLTSMDLKNRYSILTHLLADIPWTDDVNGDKRYIVNDIESALWQKKDYLLSGYEMNTNNIFDVIIDRSLLELHEYNSGAIAVKYGDFVGKYYTKMAVKGDVTVPANCIGGIIVTEGTVTLDHDFTGLIIAGKDIKIIGSAQIYSSREVARLLIENEYAFAESVVTETPFKDYFHAFKRAVVDPDSREEIKVETVDYRDLVNINNWRKYED